MPLDQRLRDGLHRDADAIEPDVLAGLESVTRRASRGPGTTGRLMLSAAAIIVVLVLVRIAGVAPHIEVAPGATPSTMNGSSASPSSSAGFGRGVTGTWMVTLAPADTGVESLGLAGDWTMRLGADSTVEVVPPQGFQTPSGGDPGGYAYAVTGPSLVTNHQTVADRVAANREELAGEGCTSDPAGDRATTLGGEAGIAWSYQCTDAFSVARNGPERVGSGGSGAARPAREHVRIHHCPGIAQPGNGPGRGRGVAAGHVADRVGPRGAVDRLGRGRRAGPGQR